MKKPAYLDCYWVVDGKLLAGEYPGSYLERKQEQRLNSLIEAQASVFIDLTHPGECPPYEPALQQTASEYDQQVTYHRISIPDFSLPTRDLMEETLDTIDQEIAAGKTVYVHCRGGIARTGMVVGCYLVRHGMTGSQALTEIARLRRDLPSFFYRSPESDEQCKFVLNWAKI